MKEIKSEIGSDGKLIIEFSGFVGDECSAESIRLKRRLLELGVQLDTNQIIKKKGEQITDRIPTKEHEHKKVFHLRR